MNDIKQTASSGSALLAADSSRNPATGAGALASRLTEQFVIRLSTN